MLSCRSLTRLGAAAAAFAIALPAAAGILAPQLRALTNSYRHSPETTVTRAAQATAEQSPRLFLPHVSATGKVQVYMHFENDALPTREALSQLGASDVLVSRPLGVIQAWIPIAHLGQAVALAGISRVDLPDYAYVKRPRIRPAASCAVVPGGLPINHEGLAAENVEPLHDQGITGRGVKVGIISTGVECLASSQSAGYLPDNVRIVTTGSGNEGIAMLEEVHAMAPDAELGFCSGLTSADFLNCFDQFANWGAQVISDDIFFFSVGYNFSVFTNPATGGNAIVEFANGHPGISLTTLAGNNRQGYYEADYFADASPHSPDIGSISLSPIYTVGNHSFSDFMAANRSYSAAMDFGRALGQASDAAVTVTIGSGSTLRANFTWNDPVNGPYDDLDLFLFKADGSLACQPTVNHWCSSTMDQMTYAPQGLPPHEILFYTNDTDSQETLYLVALCYDCNAHGSNPLHVKLYGLMNGGGSFNYQTGGGVYGKQTLDVEITVAAAYYRSNDDSSIEEFSDTGPFTYGDWTQAPKTRQKPDITGTDGVTISGAGGFGDAQSGGGALFYGTSAASPNVGAVIALLRSFAPSAEPNAAGWKQLIMAHANPDALTNYTVNGGGAGLVDAAAALDTLDEPITATITAPVATSGTAIKIQPNRDVQFGATCDYAGSRELNYRWSFGGNSGIPGSTKLTPDPVQYANGGIYSLIFTCADEVQSKSDQATVAVQAAATAEDLSLETAFETAVTGQFQGSGIGGEQVAYEIVAPPTHGNVQANGTSSFVYTPANGYSGDDSFTYAIDNGVEKSNMATVSITVGAAPPPPDGGGGGGAFGGFALGLLGALLLALRRKR